MTAKAVWGVIIIVLSVCLAIFSGLKVWAAFDAESQMDAARNLFGGGLENLSQAMGVDLKAQIFKSKVIYTGLILVSVIGAVVGTKLLKKPTQ